jgi:hypothetical protein
MNPVSRTGRAHFYAPHKRIGDQETETLWFNIAILWLASILLYTALYFKLLKKAVNPGTGLRNYFTVKAGRKLPPGK